MESDLVARLRAVLNHDRAVELTSREAADEIERLREALERQRFRAISAQMDADTLKLLLKKAGRE